MAFIRYFIVGGRGSRIRDMLKILTFSWQIQASRQMFSDLLVFYSIWHQSRSDKYPIPHNNSKLIQHYQKGKQDLCLWELGIYIYIGQKLVDW